MALFLVHGTVNMKLHLQPLLPLNSSFSKSFLPLLQKKSSFSESSSKNHLRCSSLEQQEPKVDAGIACEPCDGRGWLLCDFCKGQKTSVRAENNRIYRRCPSCKAVGYTLCSKCKVFKCVTFPNYDDGEDIAF